MQSQKDSDDSVEVTTVSKTVLNSIEAMVHYAWRDEEKDYAESDCPKGHVFGHINRVNEWLQMQNRPLGVTSGS